MSQLFSESGSLADISIDTPSLLGSFVPSIDKSSEEGNGLGLVSGWGSDVTTKSYSTYYTADSDSSSTSTSSSTSSVGGTFSYDISGLVGATGATGAQGEPGITTIQSVVIGGSSDLSSTLTQLELWDAAEDTVPYGATSHIVWEENWTKLDVASIKTWNDSAISGDGSFMLLASDSGIYVSTDTGSSWSRETPSAEDFLIVDVSDASGAAVALDEAGRDYGKFWKSTDYGASWSEIQISV